MKISVISGSPKGKNSITLQSVLFLQKRHPEVEFSIFHVGQKIKAYERKLELFNELIDSVKGSDAVLWVYPVYTFLTPYQVVRFTELIFERDAMDAFAGKYACQISTSKHFFDHTAANYIDQISEDLGMQVYPAFCADMNDLMKKQGRADLRTFGEDFFSTIKEQKPLSRIYLPVNHAVLTYRPVVEIDQAPRKTDHRIVLVTDCNDPDSNLAKMIDVYENALPYELEIVNLNDFKFAGGCLGCFGCAVDGTCVYKDGFDKFHTENIRSAECVIFAMDVKRHWFNSVWKLYDDRQFYNGHRTTAMGTSLGYLLSGPLRQEANLRQVIDGRNGVGHTYLLDIVTDEYDTDEEITALIENMAQKTAWAVENKPQHPVNFLGEGGMKVFRDLIYIMRGLMKEDHRFYRKAGLYKDLPQRQIGWIMGMQFVGFLTRLPGAEKRSKGKMMDYMLWPYRRAIEKEDV